MFAGPAIADPPAGWSWVPVALRVAVVGGFLCAAGIVGAAVGIWTTLLLTSRLLGEPVQLRKPRGFEVIASAVAGSSKMSITVPTLILPPALHRRIESEGEAGYPNEVCGMIFGRDEPDAAGAVARRVAERLVPGANVFAADEQYHRFSIDPLQQLKAERAAERDGLVLLGYYHSHPDHPARPSEYDREHAWEVYSYVIVSVANGKAADLTSWVLDGGTRQFARQEVAAE